MKSSLRMSVSGRGLLCLIVMWFLVGFFFKPVLGNNIRINGIIKVSPGTGDTLVLEFPLQWDNSWRDEFNWDAAWVFLKYKVGSGDWKPVRLSFGGHSFSSSSGQPVHFDYMPGQPGSNTLGLFVYRSKSESGNTPEIICKLKCLKSALGGIDAGKFDKHEAFIRAQAIEMAYIPYGAYYLGDNASNRSFAGIEKTLYGSIPESSDIVNNTSGYGITASHAYYPATNVADHLNNSAYPTGSWYTSTTTACWWKIDFLTPKTVRYFGVSGAANFFNHAPNGVWYLEGSNDDAAWTTLSAVDPGVWRATTTSYPVQQSIKVNHPGSYRYYRLNIPKNYHTIAQNIAMTEDPLYPSDNTVGGLVDSESACSFVVDGNDITIPETYPKGYKGFYTMKYELSQEQYVAFLNSLSYAQQQERVPGLASMKEGDYIFGDRTQPSNRNGICVAVASFSNQPVIFANNLTNDGKYAQDNDGKTIACNYLSPNDMLGYCSWSGLRPMSELEYEKACRPIYPELALSKGYAWNATSIPGRLASVTNGGQRNELSGTSNANVNAGNTFGPVRCGLFATSASNQQAAGATFWGVTEMSGNLKEFCYNIGAASTFNGGVLGDGSYSLTSWNNAVANFGVRGGGFTSGDDLLRVSDRTEATGYFTSLEQHDSTVTFRGVYPIAGAVDAGTIEAISVCPDNIGIKSVTDASCKFALSYLWYVLRPGSSVWEMIPGETRAAISNYELTDDFGTDASRVYTFKRKAVASVGEATTAEVSLTIPNMKLTLSFMSAQIDACDNSTTVTAFVPASGASYQWTYNRTSLSTTNTYTPLRAHFSGGGENFTVTCSVSASGCTSKTDVNVYVPLVQTVASTAVSLSNCGAVIFNYGGGSYCTFKIGSQCWTGKNMNVGTRVAGSDYNTHITAGIQKMCYGNNESYCDKYGGLYSWYETVNGDNAGSIKYSPGSSTQIQGICPDGWHVPSDAEWMTLEMALGMTSSQANTTGYRGTDQGTQLKEPGTFDGYNWCSGTDCNKSGFNGRPGGCREYAGGSFNYVGYNTWFWSATESGSDAWIRHLDYSMATVYRYSNFKTYGFSVRCLKD